MTKQVLDIKQMQHLQKLGLELKDTLLYWAGTDTEFTLVKDRKLIRELVKSYNKIYIPAYTLQDVLYALPARIEYKDTMYYLMLDKSDGCIAYYRIDIDGNRKYARYEVFYNGIDGLSAIDASYELLVWCIDNGYVETNKNE